MCGRFALGIPKKRLEEVFGTPAPEEYAPRYNLAPGQDIPAVASTGMAMRRWGLVPHWAKDPSVGFKMINARSETVFEKPAFREPVRVGRCLVPAQAFYEWKAGEQGKQPYAIGVADSDLFAMAGVSARWQDAETGEVVDSVAVLTCASNELMASIHDRMPVILPSEAWSAWLDPAVTKSEILAPLLVPFTARSMRAWTVSQAVNKVVHEGPELLERVDVLRQGSLF